MARRGAEAVLLPPPLFLLVVLWKMAKDDTATSPVSGERGWLLGFGSGSFDT